MPNLTVFAVSFFKFDVIAYLSPSANDEGLTNEACDPSRKNARKLVQIIRLRDGRWVFWSICIKFAYIRPRRLLTLDVDESR